MKTEEQIREETWEIIQNPDSSNTDILDKLDEMESMGIDPMSLL